MADLIHLGCSVNIKNNGLMKGFLNGKVVLKTPMKNNVWKTDIKELYENIQNAQDQKAKKPL